jgi:hypothetical protein
VKIIIKYILAFSLLGPIIPELTSQEPLRSNPGVGLGIIEGNDTIPMFNIPEVTIFKYQYDYLYLQRRYRRLIHNVKKAYPYAQIAGIQLKELDEHLLTLKSEKARDAYLKMQEKEIMDQFAADVKRLTITQGIILVKLIDRETGRTSYEVIKELKGGFTAFFWQGVARVFGNNLKLQYDPYGSDRIIEDIVQGIEAGFI